MEDIKTLKNYKEVCYNSFEVKFMNEKERCLKFIKDFNNVTSSSIFKKLNFHSSSFYTYEYSLENMQKVTDEMRKQLKEIYIDLNDNNFILNTKEKNIEFVKDINNVGINRVCEELKIGTSDIYSLKASQKRYNLVVDEIKRQLDEVYEKYNKNT